jgi:hypothetical protein
MEDIRRTAERLATDWLQCQTALRFLPLLVHTLGHQTNSNAATGGKALIASSLI